MIRQILFLFALMFTGCSQLLAQDRYTENAKKYVQQYYPLAIEEQKASGIPAAITLGQGILETEAGTSELMVEANNHFGIKCKNNWQGETYLHDDDTKNECFKKYKNPLESYRDHSAHLLNNPRYAPLFKCSKTDYAAWAVCLKKCGYATNPRYAQRLIEIIETFKLQEYTYAALDSNLQNNFPTLAAQPSDEIFIRKTPLTAGNLQPADTAHEVVKTTVVAPQAAAAATGPVKSVVAAPADTLKNTTVSMDTIVSAQADNSTITSIADSAKEFMAHQQEQAEIHAPASSDTAKIVLYNGLKAFFAHKGEMLLEYAVKYKIRYPHLLELNDLKDEPLPFDMYVYLEKKLTSGLHDKHTVREGENLLMISQVEGIQLKKLMSLNLLTPGEEPFAGDELELQAPPGKESTKSLGKHTASTEAAHDTTSTNMTGIAQSEPSPKSIPDTAGTEKPAAKNEEDASFGMSFAAPAESKKQAEIAKEPVDAIKSSQTVAVQPAGDAAIKKPTVVAAMPQAVPVLASARQETAVASTADMKTPVTNEVRKLPFMKDDPQQPQLKAPPTEKEYKKGDKYYIVKRGDTAYSIAKRHEITVAQLLKWNDTEPQDIKAGQTLKVME